jgi:hypothetical protein
MELGDQVALFVRDYRNDNPELSDDDIALALARARGQLGVRQRRRCSTRKKIMVALCMAIGVGGSLFALGRFRPDADISKAVQVFGLGMAAVGASYVVSEKRGRCR